MNSATYLKLVGEISELDNLIESVEKEISEKENELYDLQHKLEMLQVKRSNLEYDIDEQL